MGKSYDWDKWRRRYVASGDGITLESIANEPGAPSLSTLKKRSMSESWSEQRKVYRNRVGTLEEQEIAQSSATQRAIAKVDRIIDTAEMITRHTQASRWLMALGKKALERAEVIPAHVAVQMIKLGLEGERICMGLDSDRASQSFNPDELSDEELQKIADS